MLSSGRGSVEFAVALSEGDIRELAGKDAFAGGDALQRAGHVQNPIATGTDLQAEVLGTWRRIDTAVVSAAGRSITARCSCGYPSPCRHAVAVTLQWVRAPETFAPMLPPQLEGIYSPADDPLYDDYDDFDDDEFEDADADALAETDESEYNRLLTMLPMQQLRAMAKARGLRIVAPTKTDLLQQLAPALASPEHVDAALERLSEDQLTTLDAVALMAPSGTAETARVTAAYGVLGGKEPMKNTAPPAIQALVDGGLIFPQDRQMFPSPRYTIPRAVAARIPPRPGLIRRIDRERIEREGSPPRPRLSLEEVFLVIAHAVRGGKISLAFGVAGSGGPAAGIRMAGGGASQIQGKGKDDLFPALLPPEDVRHLQAETGERGAMLEFAVGLMIAGGFIQFVPGAQKVTPMLDESALAAFLTAGSREQLQILLNLWLAQPEAVDLRPIVGPGRPLILHLSRLATSWYGADSVPRTAEVRRLLMRFMARTLPLEEASNAPWFEVSSLVDLYWKLVPDALGMGIPYAGQDLWWFSSAKSPRDRLDLKTRDGWLQVWKPLLSAILTGPMTWLRLIEVHVGSEGPIAFRFRPEAAVLAPAASGDRGPQLSASEPLRLEVDRTDGSVLITVPSGGTSADVHGLFVGLADFAGVGGGGLRYRLGAETLSRAFAGGVSGDRLIEILSTLAGGSLPPEVQATLERWWGSFGAVRLYDDVTLIEVADEILLRELDVRGSLSDAILDYLSPTVVAVDGAKAAKLIAEWNGLGHAPRVLTGA